MNKEQAQIYINNVKQHQKMNMLPKKLYYPLFLVVLAIMGAALGFCHTLPMIVIVCVLCATVLVFAAVTVRAYMSILRLNAFMCVMLVMLVFALNCVQYAMCYYAGVFVVWEFCVCIAVQIALFCLTVLFVVAFANKAKPKKAAVSSAGIAAFAGCTFGRAFASTIFFISPPSSRTVLLIITICINVLACIFIMCVAFVAVNVYLMLKYDIEYKSEWQTIDVFCDIIHYNEVGYRRNFVAVEYAFSYNSLNLNIRVGLWGKCKLLVFDGDKLIKKEKYKNIETLFADAEIDNHKLADIWSDVKPM